MAWTSDRPLAKLWPDLPNRTGRKEPRIGRGAEAPRASHALALGRCLTPTSSIRALEKKLAKVRPTVPVPIVT